MAFSPKEQEIINWGVQNGKSKEAVSSALLKFRASSQSQVEPSFAGELKQDLDTRVERTGEILDRPSEDVQLGAVTIPGGLVKGTQLLGQGAGLAANAIEKTIEQIPGVKQAFGAIGSGINWLATSDYSPIKKLGGVIGENEALQEAVRLYDTDQNFKDSVDAVANIVRLGGDVQLASDAVNLTKNVTNKIIDRVKSVVPPDGGSGAFNAVTDKITSTIVPESAGIMNRVARLTPKEATQFEKLAGETHGEYLTRTGNFGAPDKIVTNEAAKFTSSKASVDAELAKLNGLYKNGAIDDALNGLLEKAKAESSPNVKAEYLDEVTALKSKYDNQGGLSMADINQVKRLYERKVKLGYDRLLNGEKIAQATNVDSALREWQVNQAKELGFTNISELNKQTQLSRFLVNKLGDQIVGKTGLNGVSLTDWIMLSGGDATSVAGFLTKKFFSSKNVQAKIAEMLNQAEIEGQVLPKTIFSPENARRKVSPTGALELPAGKTDVPPSQGLSPIPLRAPIIDESRAIAPKTTSVNKTGDAFTRDLKTGKVQITPSKQTPQPQPKKVESPSTDSTTQSLLKEARKYKSAEDFVKAGVYSPARDSGARGVLRKEIEKVAEIRNANTLTPNPNNPQLDKSTINIKAEDIADGRRPYVLIEGDMIIDGHHAFEAYKKAGIEDVPVVTKSQLTSIWEKANKK